MDLHHPRIARHVIQLVALLFLLGCNPAGSALEEGRELATAGQHDEAIAKLTEVKDKWPDAPEAQTAKQEIPAVWLAKAESLAKNKKFDKAISELEALQTSWPDATEALTAKTRLLELQLARAAHLASRGESDQALAAYEALLGGPSDEAAKQAIPGVLLKKAEAASKSGQSKAALAQLDDLQAKWPDSREAKSAAKLAGDLRCEGGQWGAYFNGRFAGGGGDTEEECNATVKSTYLMGAAMGLSTGSGPPPCTCRR